jgi:hypothetical protein
MELVSKLWYHAWTDLRIIAIRISHMAWQASGCCQWFYMCFLRSVSLSKLFRFISAVDEVHREVRAQHWFMGDVLFFEGPYNHGFHLSSEPFLYSRKTTKMEVALSLQLRLHVTLFLDFWRSHLVSLASLRMVRVEFWMECDSDDTPTNSLACHSLFFIIGLVYMHLLV